LKNSVTNNVSSAKSELLAGGKLLGLLGQDPEDWFKWQPSDAVGNGLSDANIDELIRERVKARTNKDFSTSDRIRDQLVNNNIILEDTKNGTIWRRSLKSASIKPNSP
jgi:cysteinyl-tRNA synthetase